MTLFSALNDDQWEKLLAQVAAHFNEVTLSRGFTYFKQQRVESLAASKDRVIKARVSGSEDYTVTLKLNQFKSNYCTCPVGTYCKHMAAVLMELADRLGYPASQIVNAKHYMKRLASVPAQETLLKSLPDMDISGWHNALDQYAAPVQPAYDQDSYSVMLRHHLLKMPPVSLSETDKLFWELHQKLFILHKLKKQSAQSSVNYFTSYAQHRLYEEIQSFFQQKSDSAGVFGFTVSTERLKQTADYIRGMLAEEPGHQYLAWGLHTALWKNWIVPSPDADQWISREIDDIEEQLADSTSASLLAAQAFLYMLQSKGQEAWAALEATGTLAKAPASLFYPFLDHMAAASDWEGLADWLVKTSSCFYGKTSGSLDSYMNYWKKAVAHMPQAETLMWRVLEGMLPHSARIVEDLLYEQRQWKPWLEMQIYQGQGPHYHRVSVLQPIEKEAPELLLPYYHQTIEQYVALKNRDSYKLAVKLLKRLGKVYKKMKQNDRWDRFIAGFAERYSRLRALQEELKKGKLLE